MKDIRYMSVYSWLKLYFIVRIKFNGPAVEDLNALMYAKNFVKSNQYADALPKQQKKHRLHLKRKDELSMELDDDVHFSKTIIY